MTLERIDTAQIKNQVYKKCRDMIIHGDWKPGDKLPSESKLCEQLGVSRVSVRSALQSLQAQGYIAIKRGEGSYVKQFSISETLDILHPIIALEHNDILEVLEFRLLTEPYIMPVVVQKASEQDILFLEKILDKMKESTEDIRLHAKLDEQFHMKLTEIVSNSVISKVYRVLIEVFNTSWNEVCGILGSQSGIEYHTKLVDAIKSRDEETALQVMKNHVENTYLRIKQHYQEEDGTS